MQINKIPVFTSEVFTFELPNFNVWKKQIKQIVLVENNKDIHGQDTSPKNQCNVMAKRTACNSHLRYNSLNLLCEEIKNYLCKFVENEGYDIPSLEVENCWINWYNKDNYSQPHNHGSCLSVVIFVDVENTDAKFFFHANNNFVLVKKNEAESNYNNVKQLTAKDGTVIFFDGSLQHSVSANKSTNTRITVAINYDVDYKEERA